MPIALTANPLKCIVKPTDCLTAGFFLLKLDLIKIFQNKIIVLFYHEIAN